MTRESGQSIGKVRRTQLGVQISPEILEVFADGFGHGDRRVIVNAALLLWGCASPVLQLAFRTVYREVMAGRLTLAQAAQLYAVQPSGEIVARVLGSPAIAAAASLPPQTPEPQAPPQKGRKR